MKALVVGGGVGGLASAVALQRCGFEVTVFEKAPRMRTTGFGLNLWPNSGRALYDLGLREPFDQLVVPLERYLTLGADGSVIRAVDVSDWGERFGAPATGVARRGLNKFLFDAVGRDNVKYGHEVSMVWEDDHGVVCSFTDGREERGDLLIGADGVNSRVRACLFGTFPYRDNPFHEYRWRGIVRLVDTDIDGFAETEVYGGRSFFGSIPIGKGQAYWFASGPGLSSYQDVCERYSSWTGSHVPRTLEATVPNEVFSTRLTDLAELPEQWTQGRITLLGDAAHPMMPDFAQGASTTFVDAAVLGECFRSVPSEAAVEDALREYEARRRPAAYEIVSLSQRGVFTRPQDGLDSEDADPIALRYMRYIEGVDVQAMS